MSPQADASKETPKRPLVILGLIALVTGGLLVVALLWLGRGADVAPDLAMEQPTRVLFIGNSYIFINDLPGVFAGLAQSGGHAVDVDMSARGGWTLADHATATSTLDMIGTQDWDYVVLQEHSARPVRLEERERYMYPSARLLDGEIRQGGAGTVFFMTWGHRDGLPSEGYGDFGAMQAELYAGYMAIAAELDAAVAPVGITWQNALARDPQLDLWQRDGGHPSEQGAYLTACVFYAVIYRESPEGLSYVGGLPEDTARFLQVIAAETVLEDPGRWNLP